MSDAVRAWRITRLKGEACVTWEENAADGGLIRRRYRLGTTDPREAHIRAATRYATLTRPTGKTVRDLWKAYTADKSGKPVLETMRYTWKAIATVFADIKGDDILDQHCRNYTALRRAAGKSDGTIHTELGHLRTVLVWAKDKKLISDAPKIERPSKPDPKDRFLTKVEARKLLDNAKVPHIALSIMLLTQTGARATAALQLTWDRVDFERGIIQLANPLDKVARKGRATVPMSDALRDALTEAHKGAMTPFVIEWAGDGVKSIKRGVKAAAKSAGLVDVSPHVLRHSVAVWLVEDGHSFEEVAQLLGHSDVRVTYKVYARYSPTHLRKLTSSLEI